MSAQTEERLVVPRVTQDLAFQAHGITLRVETFYEGRNLSLRGLAKEETGITKGLLGEILRGRCITRVLAPTPSFFPKMVTTEDLTTAIELGSSSRVLRNEDCRGDGILLAPGDALISSPGGCGYILLFYKDQNGGRVAALHCAQESLFGFKEKTERKFPSIIDAAFAHLQVEDPSRVHAYGLNFLSKDALFHPFENKAGYDNKELEALLRKSYGSSVVSVKTDGVGVDLAAIARIQLEYAGVTPRNIDFSIPMPEKFPHTHRDENDPLRGHRYLLVARRVI